MQWWQLRKRDADLKRELRSDLELEEEEQREKGTSPEEANYAARRAFGNILLIREKTHEVWGWAWFERFLADGRYALRALLKSPGFALDSQSHAGAWHWRQCGDLQSGKRHHSASAALSKPQRTGRPWPVEKPEGGGLCSNRRVGAEHRGYRRAKEYLPASWLLPLVGL